MLLPISVPLGVASLPVVPKFNGSRKWGMATKSEIWGYMQIYSNSKRVCEEVFIRHIPFLLIGYLVNWHIEL